jgi:general secretion pathway protein G
MSRPSERRRSRRAFQRQGFTLMEMLLVLAILVILMGLVGPRILGSQKKADINTTKTQLGMFKTTLNGYALDLRTFPGTEDGLIALLKEPADPDAATKWGGPYLDGAEIPKDPWGNEYQYEYPPSHSELDFPDIWSFGPDGEDGTEDDIVNWSQGSATGDTATGPTAPGGGTSGTGPLGGGTGPLGGGTGGMP